MTSEKYTVPKSQKEILKSGSYLQCFCPYCRMSFNVGKKAIFDAVNADGKKGELKLSPYLNVFKRESTISLEDGENLEDLSCHYCGRSLVSEDKKCGECGGTVAQILITAYTKLIGFQMCLNVGCHWHGLSKEDEENIKLDESQEW